MTAGFVLIVKDMPGDGCSQTAGVAKKHFKETAIFSFCSTGMRVNYDS